MLSRDEFLEMDLAVRLEDELLGEDLATIIGACCWVLAGLLLQTERARGVSVERGIQLIAIQLHQSAERMRPMHASEPPVVQ